MIAILSILFLSIASWTAITLRKRGEKHDEILCQLDSLKINSRDFSRSLGSLIILLIKDSLKAKSLDLDKANKVTSSDLKTPEEAEATVRESDCASALNSIAQPEADEVISNFSPEVLNLIQEESAA